MKTVSIDGSMGEGGGQVLRSSLTASMLTGAPVVLERIRAGRPKPGLMRQHRMAVEAATAISGGEAEGAAIGSTSLRFTPGKVRAGNYTFAIATAGSANLVLQTILLPLALADGPSTVVLEGGTHNPMAPPFEFLVRTFLPLLARMGAKVALRLERYGFFPAGGGRLVVGIEPVAKLAPLNLLERGELKARRGEVIVANLPASLGHRQAYELATAMGWPADVMRVSEVASAGPGNVLMLEIESGDHTEVITGFGERGLHTSNIVRALSSEANAYLASDAAVGEHLADQLLLPCVLAGGGRFTAVTLTEHTTTNATVLEKFFPMRVEFERRERSTRVAVV